MRSYITKIMFASLVAVMAVAAIPLSSVSASTDKVAVYRFFTTVAARTSTPLARLSVKEL